MRKKNMNSKFDELTKANSASDSSPPSMIKHLEVLHCHRSKAIHLRRVLIMAAAITACKLLPNPVEAGQFTPTGSLGEARANHTATVLADGKVLVAGGAGTTNFTPGAEL